MKHICKINPIFLTGILFTLITAGVLYAKAIPAGPVRKPQQSVPVAKGSKPTKYDRALAKYLDDIDGIVCKRTEADLLRFKESMALLKQRDAQLADSEAQTLELLKKEIKKRPSGKLDFDGVCIENKAFVPDSDVSARIFTSLTNEHLVDVDQMVTRLFQNAGIVSSSWIPVLQVVAHDQGSPSQLLAMATLYRAGVSRDLLRAPLEQSVKHGDKRALDVLFYDVDKATGRSMVVKTQQNMDLLETLLGSSMNPEIRAFCAHFAADSGNYILAEKVCTDLLWQPYKNAHKPKNEISDSNEDHALGRAKQKVMWCLVYKIKTKTAFKQVYDYANLVWTDCDYPGTLPKEFRGIGEYPPASLDIDCAQGIIGEVSIIAYED